MPTSLDNYLPKMSFELPGGDWFSIGTMWDTDSNRQLILFQYFAVDSQSPLLEFAVSPSSADSIITAFQNSANQARYINGQRTSVYPPPVPEESALRPSRKKGKPRKNG